MRSIPDRYQSVPDFAEALVLNSANEVAAADTLVQVTGLTDFANPMRVVEKLAQVVLTATECQVCVDDCPGYGVFVVAPSVRPDRSLYVYCPEDVPGEHYTYHPTKEDGQIKFLSVRHLNNPLRYE